MTTPTPTTTTMSGSAVRKETVAKTRADLPPPRDRKKAMRPVSPPLSNVPLSRFNYLIALAAALLVAFYGWRIAQWKSEVGGWWNLALGRKPPQLQNQKTMGGGAWAGAGVNAERHQRKESDPSVEQRIEELAIALGMPSKDLASAIAGAVREYVPPASLSSIAAHETGNSDAVKYLIDPSTASSDAASVPVSTASKGFMESAFEAVVGFDEPPSELAQQ